MAIGIPNYPNIIPADADYLDGDIKDAPSGTPVNRATNGDIQQFFAKIMREASITPNGLRDNESNGYQLYEALEIVSRPYASYTAYIVQTSTNDPVPTVMENGLSGTPVFARSATGIYTVTLVGEFDAAKTIAFISSGTVNRGLTMIRNTDDVINIVSEDASGSAADGFGAYVEIRVYR